MQDQQDMINKALADLEEPAKNAALALLAEEKARDLALGIEEDMPERVKFALRNMGHANRRQFLKKLNNSGKMRNGKARSGMSEQTFKAYMDKFAPESKEA